MSALLLIKQAEQQNNNSGFNPAYGLYGAGAGAGIGAGIMAHKDMENIKDKKAAADAEIKEQNHFLEDERKHLNYHQDKLKELNKLYSNTSLEEAKRGIKETNRALDDLEDQFNKAKDENTRKQIANKQAEIDKKNLHYNNALMFHSRQKVEHEYEIKDRKKRINERMKDIEKIKKEIPGFSTKTKALGAGAIGLLGAGAYLQYKQNQNKGQI